jgi:hypothetical protein
MGMKKFQDWRDDQNIDDFTQHKVSRDEFVDVCLEYFGSTLRGSMKTYFEFKQENLTEAVETSRYAIEVNYRTTAKEALEGFAKISLGYVSAALKNHGYHTKHVFTEKPLRLLVSSRNWDDGEWTGLVTWNPDHACFVVSKGFYNKDRRSVSIQNSKKCDGESASDVAKELHNMMHHLKSQPDNHLPKLKPVPLKRGPKG